MRNPVEVLLDPWHPLVLRFMELTGLLSPTERLVAWLNAKLTR